jgi:hypothetical protein
MLFALNFIAMGLHINSLYHAVNWVSALISLLGLALSIFIAFVLRARAKQQEAVREARIEQLSDELWQSYSTNTLFHRRVQAVESGVYQEGIIKELAPYKTIAEENDRWARSEIQRRREVVEAAREVYARIAPILAMPTEKFRVSITDRPTGALAHVAGPSRESVTGMLYVNIKGGDEGGRQSYILADLVNDAVTTLLARAEISEHLLQNLTLAKS